MPSIRTLALPLPAMATAPAEGRAPLEVLAPTSRREALVMLRPGAEPKEIPFADGPKVIRTLRMVTSLKPETVIAAPLVTDISALHRGKTGLRGGDAGPRRAWLLSQLDDLAVAGGVDALGVLGQGARAGAEDLQQRQHRQHRGSV